MSHTPTQSPSGASLDEARRFELLRAQDNKPLQPPPSLRPFMARGGLAPHLVEDAERQWRAARDEAPGGGFIAEERLFVLTLLLTEHLAGDPRRVRALTEDAAARVTSHRFKQSLYARLANAATRDRDLRAADAWLALCDPRSDDLLADTTYRTAAAVLAIARRDHDGALRLLGRRRDDVPIFDSHDHLAAVLRAHALEAAGDLDAAVAELGHLLAAGAGARARLEETIATYPDLRLCPLSLPRAIEAMPAAAPRRRRGLLGLLPFGIHGLVGVGFLVAAIFVDDDALTDDGHSLRGFFLVMGASFTLLPAVLLLVVRAFGARKRRILAHGLDGVGEILSVSQTGVYVNKQPRLAIRLRVSHGSDPPWEAEVRSVIPLHQMGQLAPGVALPVKIDPRDRRRVVFIPA